MNDLIDTKVTPVYVDGFYTNMVYNQYNKAAVYCKRIANLLEIQQLHESQLIDIDKLIRTYNGFDNPDGNITNEDRIHGLLALHLNFINLSAQDDQIIDSHKVYFRAKDAACMVSSIVDFINLTYFEFTIEYNKINDYDGILIGLSDHYDQNEPVQFYVYFDSDRNGWIINYKPRFAGHWTDPDKEVILIKKVSDPIYGKLVWIDGKNRLSEIDNIDPDSEEYDYIDDSYCNGPEFLGIYCNDLIQAIQACYKKQAVIAA